MKKLVRSVLMLSMASIAILSSCSKEDDNDSVTDVTVSATATPANPVLINTPVTLTITMKGETKNNLTNISVTRNGVNILSKGLKGIEATETLVDTLGNEDLYTYVIAVNGEKGTAATATVTVVTKQPAGKLEVTATPVPLFSQLYANDPAHFMQITEPFATFKTGDVAANKSSIDIVYYYGGNKHTLTSPSDVPMQQQIYTAPNYNWTGAKDTKLSKAKIDAAEFDAFVQDGSDESLVIEGKATNTWSTAVKDLKAGDVLIYKTAAGKYGYIKIETVEGANGTDSEIGLKFVTQQI